MTVVNKMYPTKEELKKTVVSETVKNDLRDQIIALTTKYGYHPTKEAVDKILDTWEERKKNLHFWLSSHAAWDEKRQMISFRYDYTRPMDEQGIRDFYGWLTHLDTEKTTLAAHPKSAAWKVGHPEWSFEHMTIYFAMYSGFKEILFWIRDNRNLYLDDDAVDLFNNWDEEHIHAHRGQKVTKAIKKFLAAWGVDTLPDFNSEWTKYCDAINPAVMPRNTVISINPIDYLTMSFGHGWTSCHTIDKQNIDGRSTSTNYHGCYSGGTLSYMLDETSLVYYTVSPEYEGKDFQTQDKVTRCMFHIGEGKMIQGRMYPQDNDGVASASDEPRSILQKIIADSWGINNYWKIEKGTGAASRYIDSCGQNYHDYECYGNCNLNYPMDMEINKNRIVVGKPAICIECGEEYSYQEAIECKYCYNGIRRVRCAQCGELVEERNAVEYDGQYYCSNCTTRICDTGHRIPTFLLANEDSGYTYMRDETGRNDTGWYTDAYIQCHTKHCAECGRLMWGGNLYQEKYYCDDCCVRIMDIGASVPKKAVENNDSFVFMKNGDNGYHDAGWYTRVYIDTQCIRCEACGSLIWKDSIVEYEGKRYCTNCTEKVRDTGNRVPKELLTKENGYVYINKDSSSSGYLRHRKGWYTIGYAADYMKICSKCGELQWKVDLINLFDGSAICHSCFDQYGDSCDVCGSRDISSNLTYDEETDRYYCANCYAELMASRGNSNSSAAA